MGALPDHRRIAGEHRDDVVTTVADVSEKVASIVLDALGGQGGLVEARFGMVTAISAPYVTVRPDDTTAVTWKVYVISGTVTVNGKVLLLKIPGAEWVAIGR